MPRIIINVSEQTHAVIKLISDVNKSSMRDFILKAVEVEIQKQTSVSTNLRDKEPMGNKQLRKVSDLFIKRYGN